MNCKCGQTTKPEWTFCPSCGGSLLQHPLASLLAYCRDHAARQRRIYEKMLAEGVEPYNEKYVPSRKVAAEKWETWTNELTKVLKDKGEEKAND